MEDWRSYNAIADAYGRTWAPRFELVARHLRALTPPVEGVRLIDLGAGGRPRAELRRSIRARDSRRG